MCFFGLDPEPGSTLSFAMPDGLLRRASDLAKGMLGSQGSSSGSLASLGNDSGSEFGNGEEEQGQALRAVTQKNAAKLAERERRQVADLLLKRGCAYRVLHCAKGSPSEDKGLVPWFDFIVKVGDVSLVRSAPDEAVDGSDFAKVVSEHENKSLRLVVYNCKNRSLRNLLIKPRRWFARSLDDRNDEDVHNTKPAPAGLSGLMVSYDFYANGIQSVHVLQVLAGSPGQAAGIQARYDYLLGTVEGTAFTRKDILHEIVKESIDNPLEFFVYNSLTDTIRIVTVTPSESWAENAGLLGIDIGVGEGHGIPEDARESLGIFRDQDALNAMFESNADSDVLDISEVIAPLTCRPPTARPVTHHVKTKLGYGQALGESKEDNSLIVELDWKLPNGAVVLFFAQEQSFEYLPQLD